MAKKNTAAKVVAFIAIVGLIFTVLTPIIVAIFS